MKEIAKARLLYLFFPLLFGCSNLKTDHILLNGIWKISMNVPESFEKSNTNLKQWSDIQVPGECQMQGFAIKHDKPFVYKKEIEIPAYFESKDIILCFDGVYSYARVWVNGVYVRDHSGGFTHWECNITSLVKPGKKAWITVEVTDKKNEQSYASGYAKHQIGGILRDVYIKALPFSRIDSYNIETDLDAGYKDAILVIDLSLQLKDDASLIVSLSDPHGNLVELADNRIKLIAKDENHTLIFSIINPLKWDAEHPRLYTLNLELAQKGKTIQKLVQKVGFRKVEVIGNKMLVNGKPVKLRGVCRHDIHPLLGRVATPDYDLIDAQLAKEANINFIRTSHYPPTKKFAALCDSIGIYLEVENAVCFVRFNRLGDYDSIKHYGPEFKESLLSQTKEMVQTFRNNPSVIIWSLGNESKYDDNFQQEYNYIKSTDKSRPVIFSYPGTVPSDKKCFDILSMHYPAYTGKVCDNKLSVTNFENDTIPTLNDEWAHVPCYNTFTLKNDPNVHDFWGESLDKMWSGCFDSKGCLGGAIWGMIDEIFMLPDTCVGYGQWGIVDTWRRQKPEFWSTKKAYSPVRLVYDKDSVFAPGKDIVLDLFNRFDHTNTSELKIVCNGKTVLSPSIPPHDKGNLTIPGNLVLKGKPVNIAFYSGEMMIDIYMINDVPIQTALPVENEKNAGINVIETAAQAEVSGKEFKVTFNKQNGLISSAYCKGTKIIDNGPYLTLVAKEGNKGSLVETAGEWKLTDFRFQKTDSVFTATILGTSGIFPVEFIIRINGNGEILTSYKVENNPETVHEAGIYYNIDKGLDKLQWNRNVFWSYYTEGHLGRPHGTAIKLSRNSDSEKYRSLPSQSWENDTKDFFLFQKTGKHTNWLPVPNDFRSSKQDILTYSLSNQATSSGIMAVSDGKLSARSEVKADSSVKLILLNKISYDDLDWGNYERPDQIERPFGSFAKLILIPNIK